MLSALGTRRARVLAAGLLVALLTTGCFGGGGSGVRTVPNPGGADRRMLDVVNWERQQRGLQPVYWDAQLGGLAADWSEHMARTGRLTHRDLGAVLASPSYPAFRGIAENIYMNPSCNVTADQVVAAWMGSSGHRNNLLNGSYNRIGSAFVCSGGRIWVTANFAQV